MFRSTGDSSALNLVFVRSGQTYVIVDRMNSKDVYWEVGPPFIVSQILGISPMTLKFNLSKTYLGYAIAIFALAVIISTYVFSFMERLNGMLEMSPFSLILERAQLIMVLMGVVICFLKAIVNIKTSSRVMKSMASLDSRLHEIGAVIPYSRMFSYYITFLRLFLISSLFLPDLLLFKSFQNLNYLLVQYVLIMPILIVNLVQVQFMVLLDVVQRRINVLISVLKNASKNERCMPESHLHTLLSVYSSLLTLCDEMNWLYSPQILFILSSVFINATANLYHVIEKLIVFITVKHYSFLAMTTYRILVRSLEVWTLVTTCVNTQDLVNI